MHLLSDISSSLISWISNCNEQFLLISCQRHRGIGNLSEQRLCRNHTHRQLSIPLRRGRRRWRVRHTLPVPPSTHTCRNKYAFTHLFTAIRYITVAINEREEERSMLLLCSFIFTKVIFIFPAGSQWPGLQYTSMRNRYWNECSAALHWSTLNSFLLSLKVCELMDLNTYNVGRHLPAAYLQKPIPVKQHFQ